MNEKYDVFYTSDGRKWLVVRKVEVLERLTHDQVVMGTIVTLGLVLLVVMEAVVFVVIAMAALNGGLQ